MARFYVVAFLVWVGIEGQVSNCSHVPSFYSCELCWMCRQDGWLCALVVAVLYFTMALRGFQQKYQGHSMEGT